MYIPFHQQDKNYDSKWLIDNSKCWQYFILALSIELMQYYSNSVIYEL